VQDTIKLLGAIQYESIIGEGKVPSLQRTKKASLELDPFEKFERQ
jgi:hypothetical protein